MFQKTFSIYAGQYANPAVYIEAGEKYIACWCKDAADKKMLGFEFFQFNGYTPENFTQLLDEVKSHSQILHINTERKKFIWNREESLCIPAAHFSESLATDYLQYMYGDLQTWQTIIQTNNNIAFVSGVPENLQLKTEGYFGTTSFFHQHWFIYQLVKNSGTSINLFFYPGLFTVSVFKEGQLQLLQTKKYTTPEDVLYFILNSCRQYAVDPATDVIACGFIDKSSKLYTTLYEYLKGFSLAETDKTFFATEAFFENPLHFFLPFANYDV